MYRACSEVIRHVREKLSCRTCDTVVAAPAPDHAIARGRAGAGLLAHIVVSKFDDHLPLYRQAEILPRGRQPGAALNFVGLGRGDGGGAEAPGRRAGRRCDGIGHTACRRHAGAGVGAGHRQDQDRAAVDLCPRRAAVRRLSTAGGTVRLLGRHRNRRTPRKAHLQAFRRGYSTPTPIPGSRGCSLAIGSPRPPAGLMSAANSSTSRPTPTAL